MEKEKNLVKETCKILNITQKELAEKIGVSPRTLNEWSSGRVEIPKIGQNILTLLPLVNEYSELKKSLQVALSGDLVR